MTRALLLALVLPLAACDGEDGHTDHTHDTDMVMNLTREATTDGGTWTVSYEPSIDPIPQSEDFSVTVTVTGPGADQVTLEWDAIMPAHNHGMSKEAAVTANGDGTFTVDGMFFQMPGHWRMMGDVSDGEIAETAVFDVECCE